MTYIIKPANHHPNLERNELGLTRRDYEGTISTLCAGCGHDSISAAVIEACYELSLSSDQIAKLSGIGCSSKSPSYFLNQAHGFNSVHGRMPSVATGANLGNQDLLYMGVSGDGDTAGIGIGQFMHAARRQLNITYIVEKFTESEEGVRNLKRCLENIVSIINIYNLTDNEDMIMESKIKDFKLPIQLNNDHIESLLKKNDTDVPPPMMYL